MFSIAPSPQGAFAQFAHDCEQGGLWAGFKRKCLPLRKLRVPLRTEANGQQQLKKSDGLVRRVS